MGQRRVAVTGMGVISAVGADLSSTWSALRQGVTGIAPIQSLDVSRFRFQNGAEVRGYDPLRHFEANRAEMLDRFAQFAVVAAREALADSGLNAKAGGFSERTAVITGSCVGGQTSQDAGFVALYRKDAPRVHPLTIPRTMANAGAGHFAMEFGIVGPAYTVSSAC